MPFVVPIEFGMPTGVVAPDDLEVELGTGWLADALRSLGLPCAPDVCLWGEGLSATFHAGRRIRTPDVRAGQRRPFDGPAPRTGGRHGLSGR